MQSTTYRLSLAAICLLGAALRLSGVGRESLVLDEVFTWLDAEGKCAVFETNRPELDDTDLKAIYRAPTGGTEAVTRAVIAQDAHPPLFFWVEHLTLRALGVSEGRLRLPALAAGVAAIPLIAALGRACFDAPTGLCAAALWAVMPYPVLYSRQARPYTMMVCFLLLALRAVQRAVREPGRRAAWGWLTLWSSLALWTHYGSFLALLPAWGWIGYRMRSKPERRLWLLSAGAVAAGCLPWVPAFWRQQEWLRDGAGWLTESVPAGWMRPAGALRGIALVIYTLLLGEPAGPLRGWAPDSLMRAGLFAGWLYIIGYGAVRGGERPVRSFLLLTAGGAFLLAGALYLAGIYLLAARYLMGILPVGAIWMARGLTGQRGRPWRLSGMAMMIAAGALAPLPALYRGERPGAEGWREAALRVAQRWEPEDLLLFNAPGVRIAFEIYFPFSAKAVGAGNERDAPGLVRKLERSARKRPRVWAIFSHTDSGRGKEIIRQWLNGRFPRRTDHRFPGVQVSLYEAKGRCAPPRGACDALRRRSFTRGW